MKRAGFFVSLIMAVFCIGILSAGVFAASTVISNTITGVVTVVPPEAS